MKQDTIKGKDFLLIFDKLKNQKFIRGCEIDRAVVEKMSFEMVKPQTTNIDEYLRSMSLSS